MSSTEPIVGNVREAGYRRVSHGLFLPHPIGGTTDEQWRRVLEALLLVLPDGAAFTGITAARLRGWWLPPLPDWVPVFVCVPPPSRGPQRPGIVVSRFDREPGHQLSTVHGLPVDEPAEVLLRCARELGVLDLVPLCDRSLALGHVEAADLTRVTERRRPAVPRLRTAHALADRRSESPWESILRVFHHTLDVDVDVQPDLHDAAGRFIGRGDLRVTGTNAIHEYDGSGHRDAATHRSDLRRDRKLAEAGYVRRGYSAPDMVRDPAVTMAEIDRALGRRSRPARLDRWRRLLAASALSDLGRERLRNRWVRDMGRLEWWRSAP